MGKQTGLIRESDFYSERFDYDGSGNLLYYGAADVGSPSSSPAWQIVKMTYDGSGNLLSYLYANGSAQYNQAWDDRASLTYS